MSALRQALADYLAVRRILGYRLARAEKLLAQFLTFIEGRGEEHLTIESAIAWATAPENADPSWQSCRLSNVRRFALHLRGIDPDTGDAADKHSALPISQGDALPLLRRGNLRADGGDHDLAWLSPPSDLSDVNRSASRHRHEDRGGDPAGSA